MRIYENEKAFRNNECSFLDFEMTKSLSHFERLINLINYFNFPRCIYKLRLRGKNLFKTS